MKASFVLAVIIAATALAGGCAQTNGKAVSEDVNVDYSCITTDDSGSLNDNGVTLDDIAGADIVAIRSVDVACIPTGIAMNISFISSGIDVATPGYITPLRSATSDLTVDPSGSDASTGWIQFISVEDLERLDGSIDVEFYVGATRSGTTLPSDNRTATITLTAS